MAILNYTTKIAAEKTGMEIQKKLAMAGAQAVLMEYDNDGVMEAISFRISTPTGNMSFRLPAQIDGVLGELENAPNVPRRLQTRDQAARVTWRILKDWIEAQIAIIDAGMAELPQVFLPYAQDKSGRTVYEALQEGGLKQLTHG